ncbi:hypothetical protein HU200_038755 [Digitaria exilis]|uniref:RING-type E3 ubiquitin transferase n=1 Tax=Digitaria exilis TaxID=1010633 RepID=A0A835BJC2_9POAL|nr:hypothetical protein HU200_038755 [Digitaria exilis]
MVALLAAVVAVFVFIAASTIYLRHCTGYNIDAAAASTWRPATGDDGGLVSSRSWWQRRRRRGSSRGLDADAIEAFPTMTYAEAKALRVGKGVDDDALECAVCLSEFEDGDKLRLLLPRCSHAFHPDCIAQWLAGHVTCPVCRCNLQPTSHHNKDTSISNDVPFASSVSSETAAAAWQDGGPLPVAVVIDVVTEEELRQEEMELQRIGTQRRAVRSSGRQPQPPTTAQLAGRWRSTGDLERYTLRLPESVRREMVAASEHSSLQVRRRGEERGDDGGSGRSEPLIAGRPGTWQTLLGRSLSGKLPFFSASRRMTPTSSGDGEVSSSYTRLRGRRVAAVADGGDPAEGEGATCVLDPAGAASSEVAAGAAADEEKAVKELVWT